MSDSTPAQRPTALGDWRWWLVCTLAAALLVFGSRIPFATPPVVLALGLVLAIAGLAPKSPPPSRLAKWCIQVSVVLLGAGMDLHEVLRAGVAGLLFSAGSIFATLVLADALGRVLRTDRAVTTLVGSGTAICGGSAIAAVGSAIRASSAPMGVALATVFMLNALGVFLFPPIGRLLHLSAEQFGVWSAVAVHDIAGVNGAADAFDHLAQTSPRAVTIATAVKLARTLWIIPLTMYFGWRWSRHAHSTEAARSPRVAIPWFIALFLLVAGARTLWPPLAGPLVNWFDTASSTASSGGAVATGLSLIDLAKRGMLVALLLIGCGLSIRAIREVGWRALALGAALWVIVSLATLALVVWGWNLLGKGF